MMGSQVYEFPYSGSYTSSIPFFNYNPNVSSTNPPPFTPNLGNNTIVIPMPDNMSLDTILRQLGVNVNSLHHSSSLPSYSTSVTQPIDFFFDPPLRRHRRRVVCREITDSESDDHWRHSSHQHHRQHHHRSESDQRSQSPAGLHSLLSNVWKKTPGKASENLSQSNAGPNMNPQRQPIPNTSLPASSQQQGGIGNIWNRAANAVNQQPSGPSSPFNRMMSGSGNINPPPPPPPGPQQNQEAVREFFAARNVLPGGNQPNSAVANAWNRADNVAQYGSPPTTNPPWNPMSSPPSGMNSSWNQMSGGMSPHQQPPPPMNPAWNQMYGGMPPPQQPPPPMNPVWNQMSGGMSPPQQPPPPMNPAWNQMSGGMPPPQQPPPPMNPAWNQMSGGMPRPQQPPPPMNPAWNQMSGGGPPPRQPPPQQPPPQQPPSSGISSVFSRMFGGAPSS